MEGILVRKGGGGWKSFLSKLEMNEELKVGRQLEILYEEQKILKVF